MAALDNLARIDGEIAAAQETIAQAERRIRELRHERLQETNRRRRQTYLTGERRGSDIEGLYVDATEIVPHIRRFVDAYNAEHRIGGRVVLAERANVSVRSLHRMMSGAQRHTSASSADRILVALGMPDGLAQLELSKTPWIAKAPPTVR